MKRNKPEVLIENSNLAGLQESPVHSTMFSNLTLGRASMSKAGETCTNLRFLICYTGSRHNLADCPFKA